VRGLVSGISHNGFVSDIASRLKSSAGMNMKTEICMPDDWNDHGAWEQFYAAMYAKMGKTDWVSDGFERLAIFENDPVRFVTDLKAKQWLRVWVPGCGMSPVPKILAELGLEVHATDISPTAIMFQQTRHKDGPPLYASADHQQQPGHFECQVYDVRSPYLMNYFDLVINVKAFSGFDRDTMCQVADSHYKALKPGRRAQFVTLNAQGELMDAMEDCLMDARFFLPLYGLKRWLKQTLREAGISDFATVVHHMNDKNMISILNEYQTRAQAEQEKERKIITSGEKMAQIYCLTG
jgi:hypothetical protein